MATDIRYVNIGLMGLNKKQPKTSAGISDRPADHPPLASPQYIGREAYPHLVPGSPGLTNSLQFSSRLPDHRWILADSRTSTTSDAVSYPSDWYDIAGRSDRPVACLNVRCMSCSYVVRTTWSSVVAAIRIPFDFRHSNLQIYPGFVNYSILSVTDIMPNLMSLYGISSPGPGVEDRRSHATWGKS
jgi:hypothetical protein